MLASQVPQDASSRAGIKSGEHPCVDQPPELLREPEAALDIEGQGV